MTYELAKQLKDAGFPLEKRNGGFVGIPGNDIAISTLSELIEACGNKLDEINHFPYETNNKFRAVNIDNKIEQYGKTPEEAVAKLWLALNSASKVKTVEHSEPFQFP